MPYIYFYKLLAKKPNEEIKDVRENRIKMNIPDTIVSGEKDCSAFWLYTSEEGYIYRADSFSHQTITEKFFSENNPDEIVAVIKKLQFRNLEMVGNDTRIIT